MGLADIYSSFDKYGEINNTDSEVSTPVSGYQSLPSWEGSYEALKTQPTYYRLNQYISPYASSHWESSSPVLKTLNDEHLIPPLSDKLDPNKIFSSDLTALRATAADQLRIVKVFEKKLLESLNDKNKFGLTEEDIEAMQALTAARNAIASLQKEQVSVKKNIADIRLKQQLNNNTNNGNGYSGPADLHSNPNEFGTSVLDALFATASAGQTIPTEAPQVYTTANVDAAADMIDDLIHPNLNIEKERNNIQTVVVVRDNATEPEFANVDANGNLVDNQEGLPSAKITEFDLVAKNAKDEYGRPYKVIELGNEVL